VTPNDYRKKLVDEAQGFYGYSVASGRHKTIVDIYNAEQAAKTGYVVKYTDAWCATFASVAAIKSGLTSIIPLECSCPRQIELWKKKGRWIERDDYRPQPGDYIYYDWQDGPNYATTDCTGVADHVGIVCSVTEDIIVVIEGNLSKSVGYRSIHVNDRYIRGYGVPDYDSLCVKMEEMMNMEYIVKPKKIAIYLNTQKKTMAQIKAETGCDRILNAGLFESLTKPVAQLRVNKVTYANENWGSAEYGIGWNKDGTGLQITRSMAGFDNYVGCVGLIFNGKALKPLTYPSEMGSARQRTAIGVMPDGRVWVYQTKAATTPDTLQSYAVRAGCYGAIMLDGGVSVQGICPEGTITSATRPLIHNYILIWDDKTATAAPTKYTSPYDIPTANLSYGSRAVGVKWLQDMLNHAIGSKLTVDGIFGLATRNALLSFQKAYPAIGVDGIAGPKTIAKLKEVVK